VSFAIFHPSLPIILSGSEDGTVKVWHSSTYRLENTLNYGLERAWCVAYRKSGNEVAIGFDEGAVVVKVCRVCYFLGQGRAGCVGLLRWAFQRFRIVFHRH
jgi:coatomer subunit beta'